ncbi:hypothetical protein [Photobacterium ganghwense]|uniref:hypothetical protein n=1 Tax=Photobacterium ganghwense TaxID=320778 RepID=UPI0039F01895
MFHQVMQPRQRQQFQAVGEFLYIEACPDAVQISTERGDYRLKQGAQIIDPRLTGRVTVENMGEAGTVIIVCGYGRYIPPSDGQQVAVTQMPTVTLSPNQKVNIGLLPKVQLDADQAVTVAQLPAIEFAAGQKLAVSSLPEITLAPEQAVRVSSDKPLETAPVVAASLAGRLLTIATGTAQQAANPLRCHILVKASPANTQSVTLADGWELAAGEQLKLETTAALAFAGADGDTIQIIEVLK